MGTPNTEKKSTFEKSVRQTPLSEAEWLEIVEERRSEIKPYLDKVSLAKLGDIEFLTREGIHKYPLSRSVLGGPYQLVTVGTKFLGKKLEDFQGIFELQAWKDSAWRSIPEGGGGVMKIWGLSRDGNWMLVTVTYHREPGYKDRGLEVADEISISEVDLKTMLLETKVTPFEVCRRLRNEVVRWYEIRQTQANQLQSSIRMMDFNDRLLSVIPAAEDETCPMI